MKKIKKILKYTSITLVVVFGAILFMLSRQVAGYRAFVVMSASMEPLIRTGSLIITQRVNPHTLKENDVVTFIRPDNTKEFITHRIVSVSKPDSIPLFKTKGDSNESEDMWTLVGGGVVGKVHYTIPHLGYLLSLARTKIGIAVLILLPAFFIILDEAKIILALIKKRRQQSEKKLSPTAVTFLFIGIAVYSFNAPSQAILTDSVSLMDNTISVLEASPTPTASPTGTPTPTPTTHPGGGCSDIPDVIIEGNGAGSRNEVEVDINCESESFQSNTAIIENNISVQTGWDNSQSTVNITNTVNTSTQN